MTFLPPAWPVYLFILSVSYSALTGKLIISQLFTWSLVHLVLLGLSYSYFMSWLDSVTVEIDGFMVKHKDWNPLPLKKRSVRAACKPSWPPEELLGRTPFGSVPYKVASSSGHYWSRGDAHDFVVRAVGYGSSKEKIPSAPSLYECLGVDLLRRSDGLVEDLIDHVKVRELLSLSGIPWGKGDWSESVGIPRLIILNAKCPYLAPSVWGATVSDPGFSLVSYFALPPSNFDDKSPGLELFKKLLKEGISSRDGVALKLIGRIDNIEELGLPELVSAYNGKPVLLTKSCKINSSEEFVEISFDVRMWNFLSRKTFAALNHVSLFLNHYEFFSET